MYSRDKPIEYCRQKYIFFSITQQILSLIFTLKKENNFLLRGNEFLPIFALFEFSLNNETDTRR